MRKGPAAHGTEDDPDDSGTATTAFIPVVGTLSEPDLPPVRHRPPAILVAVRVFVALLSATALAAMAVVWARVDMLQNSVTTTDAVAEAQKQPDAPLPEDGANDILLVGSDSRTDLQGNPLPLELLRELRTEATETLNTDTLIVLRFPNRGGKSYAISIPRDTYVQVPHHRQEKINSAFGITKAKAARQLTTTGETDRAKVERESDKAGRTGLVQTVQGLTGIRIDHYAEITLYGFYLLTKAIDGVDVCLKRSTKDPDSGADFRKGPQTVRGGDAVAFVRQRKNLPRGDLDRIVRQQTFLSSAMNKMLDGGMLADTAKLGALADAVSRTVVTDPGLRFLDLVNQAQAMASGQVEFVTIPVTAVGARDDRGQSIITVDLPAVHTYVAQLATGSPPSLAPPPSEPTSEPPANLLGPHPLDLNAPLRTQNATVPCIY